MKRKIERLEMKKKLAGLSAHSTGSDSYYRVKPVSAVSWNSYEFSELQRSAFGIEKF